MSGIYQFEFEISVDDMLLSNDEIQSIFAEIDEILAIGEDEETHTEIYREQIPDLTPEILTSPIQFPEDKLRNFLRKLNIDKDVSSETLQHLTNLMYTKLHQIIQNMIFFHGKSNQFNIRQIIKTIQFLYPNTKIIY